MIKITSRVDIAMPIIFRQIYYKYNQQNENVATTP